MGERRGFCWDVGNMSYMMSKQLAVSSDKMELLKYNLNSICLTLTPTGHVLHK